MKRYDLYSQDDQGNFGYANYPIPEEDGQWVGADIVQELYKTLKEARNVVQGLVDEGYFGYVDLRTKIDNVLSNADKG